ncbi:hypothetical protein F0402_20780 [Mycolicibacter arupensis]|nr:hypothetical protein F0402_20780 [Mycolicibacter arupensis]
MEAQERINRVLMYRIFGELADPPDGSVSIGAAHPSTPTGQAPDAPQSPARICAFAMNLLQTANNSGCVPKEAFSARARLRNFGKSTENTSATSLLTTGR